jgi:hypothetical protein
MLQGGGSPTNVTALSLIRLPLNLGYFLCGISRAINPSGTSLIGWLPRMRIKYRDS